MKTYKTTKVIVVVDHDTNCELKNQLALLKGVPAFIKYHYDETKELLLEECGVEETRQLKLKKRWLRRELRKHPEENADDQ